MGQMADNHELREALYAIYELALGDDLTVHGQATIADIARRALAKRPA